MALCPAGPAAFLMFAMRTGSALPVPRKRAAAGSAALVLCSNASSRLRAIARGASHPDGRRFILLVLFIVIYSD